MSEIKSAKIKNPVIPTFDKRHMPAIREGAISYEQFCKSRERRKELGLKIIYPEVYE